MNEYTAQTAFYVLCNISISDYIRKRRLTNAGCDLYNTSQTVLSAAIKYQYNNATSFSRAFEKFHGIKPSEVKQNPQGLKVYSRIEFDENIKVYAMEPDKMPMLSQNKIITSHKIEGIGDDFIPDIVDKTVIDEIITVDDDDSINMSRKIAKDLGLGVGISSGANMLASIIAKENNEKEIVTVFADDNKKYISTDLSKPIDTNSKYLSNKVDLLNYEFIN